MADKDHKYDIFISYRRTGGAQYARILQLMLQQRGYSVFLDYDELTDGKFGDHIVAAIKDAPIFMLVLSPKALERCKNNDDWVRQEIMLAVSLGKQIIPVNPDNTFDGVPTDIPEEIQTAVGTHQHSEISFGQTLGVTVDFMIEKRVAPIVGARAQRAHIDKKYEEAKLTLEKIDAHNRFMKRLGIVGVVASILIILGACGLFWFQHQKEAKRVAYRTELEKKYQHFQLYLAPDLSMDQMDIIEDILSKMVPVKPDTLWMSQFECTTKQWHGVLGGDYDPGQAHFPQADISYGDICMYYLDSLRNMTNIAFDLPSVEEWAYAAHGGSHHETTRFVGNEDADKVAWYKDNSGGHAHPSDGQQGKEPNMLDLFDMSGNVAEICNSPFVTADGLLWTVCGGHYDSPAEDITADSRAGFSTDGKAPTVGFRLIIRNNQIQNQ